MTPSYTAADLDTLFTAYADHVSNYLTHKEPADEGVMRPIEKCVLGGVSEAQAHDFRSSVMVAIGTAARRGENIAWHTVPHLAIGLGKYLESKS